MSATPRTDAAYASESPHSNWEATAARLDACSKLLEQELAAALAQVATLKEERDNANNDWVEMEQGRDSVRAQNEKLTGALAQLASYAATVRQDRIVPWDGEVMACQRLQWCEGLRTLARSATLLT